VHSTSTENSKSRITYYLGITSVTVVYEEAACNPNFASCRGVQGATTVLADGTRGLGPLSRSGGSIEHACVMQIGWSGNPQPNPFRSRSSEHDHAKGRRRLPISESWPRFPFPVPLKPEAEALRSQNHSESRKISRIDGCSRTNEAASTVRGCEQVQSEGSQRVPNRCMSFSRTQWRDYVSIQASRTEPFLFENTDAAFAVSNSSTVTT